MCGLAGYFDTASQRVAGDMHERVARMAATLVHRGPDDQGTWVDPEVGIALGSRRLAIIDVSPDGHQPMVSASGRYVIAYNGEVYNARDIARTLESSNDAPRWRGHSDTEVILAAIDAWGFAHALERFNGMFAYASGTGVSDNCTSSATAWHQAAVRGTRAEYACLRIGAAGADGPPRVRFRSGSRVAGSLPSRDTHAHQSDGL